jgi:hypothetical protein
MIDIQADKCRVKHQIQVGAITPTGARFRDCTIMIRLLLRRDGSTTGLRNGNGAANDPSPRYGTRACDNTHVL